MNADILRLTHATHEEVPVRVTAYADRGVSRLVEVLNRFDGLWSSSSCEGDNINPAQIQLRYGVQQGDYRPVCAVANKLALAVADELDSRNGVRWADFNVCVAVQWCGNLRWPFISVELPHKHIGLATSAFSAVRRRFSHDICSKPQFG
jgi:hypothetical protein